MSNDLGARLRTAKESLSTWYHHLNSRWLDAEKTIASVNLPTDVRVCSMTMKDTGELDDHVFRNLSEHGEPVEHCLAYMDYDDLGWRICYSVGEADNPDSHEPRPILNCSLKGRILALELLPKLVEAVVAAVEAQSARFEVALGGAAEALASLKVRPKPDVEPDAAPDRGGI